MGLCRCPQRKVSTLFCFKHHVNVCESCLVHEHPQCIVRSYVSWLQDNDYNPNCSLCQRSLTETGDETIRLICYDLFHWSCLDEYFRSLPANTAPDGYTCPTCHTCIFPPTNLVSPVADQVRSKLSQPVGQHTYRWYLRTNQQFIRVNNNPSGTSSAGGTSGLSHHPHRAIDMSQGSPTFTTKSPDNDPDEEDKYKRRSVFTWFARWLRSRQPTNRKGASNNRTPLSRTRYTIYMICVILLVFLTILIVLYHLTRGDNNEYANSNDDPQFNPLNNPFVRVAGRLLQKPSKDSNSPT